ncbi:MAG: alkaline phosphatase [Bacteroidaceae bacterium]|nr:alkaline phosphatase [Bacteroidaceae bacterium]
MRIFTWALIALLGLVLASCGQQEVKRSAKAKHVIMIGIDGWASKSMAQADMPTVKGKLMAEGSYTLEKRSVLPSASAINWASNFMGVGTESHGYTTWGSKVPEIPSSVTNAHGIFPTIFSILKEQQPESKTAAIFDWDGIKYVIDTLAVDHVMQRDHAGYGKEFGEDCGDPLDYVKEAVQVIKEEKPTLFAVYFGGLDETGHTYGWYTEKYYAFETILDECIAQLIEATKEAGIYDDTIFVLTADHGGIDKGHGGITLEEMLSPFIAYGKGIRQGFKMTDAMMQYDVAATVAYILGLETPQAWVGRPMTSIFEDQNN